MINKSLIVVAVVSILLTGCTLGPKPIEKEEGVSATPQVTEQIANKSPMQQAQESVSAVVPLPTGESIINTFFELINEKRIPEAVSMLTKVNTQNDSTKQAWGVQFNAFEAVKAIEIEACTTEPCSWQKDENETYKVTVEAQMKPESANAVMPYYGWDNGQNTRWVTVVKEEGLWKVSGIGTGP